MFTLNTHIPRGERTRPLFCLVSAVAAVLFILSSGPASRATASSGGYQWPLKPFDQPHPIRGSFGDPRTIFTTPPTEDGLMTGGGKFAFHFGVDIWGPNGTAVYPVVSGTVGRVSHEKHREYVVIHTGNSRSFEYWHVRAVVRPGQRVEAGATVLGSIMAPFEHVHFAEIQSGRPVNPLSTGGLTPYSDTTKPRVESISLRRTETGSALLPSFVRGRVLMVAEAYDARGMSIPGVWQPMPVAPVLVSWQLKRLGGRVAARDVAADFRHSTPANERFWSYYARGTYQNMSVFGPRYSWGQPGCFLFKLTRSEFDTSSVPDGVYDLIVTVTDIRGNTSSKALRLTIHNRAGW
jgi:hypothetical protein